MATNGSSAPADTDRMVSAAEMHEAFRFMAEKVNAEVNRALDQLTERIDELLRVRSVRHVVRDGDGNITKVVELE